MNLFLQITKTKEYKVFNLFFNKKIVFNKNIKLFFFNYVNYFYNAKYKKKYFQLNLLESNWLDSILFFIIYYSNKKQKIHKKFIKNFLVISDLFINNKNYNFFNAFLNYLVCFINKL